MLHGPKSTQRLAKGLRAVMSLPEVILWRPLPARPGDLRFRRQHPAGPYVLDFFCASRRLAVEVDGEAHNRGDRPERNVVRDAWLVSQGVKVVRIPTANILRDVEAAILHIVDTARRGVVYPSTNRFAGAPPPPPGEDL